MSPQCQRSRRRRLRFSEDLGNDPEPAAVGQWNNRCTDLFVDLLHAMSQALGFRFDKVQLRRGVYQPQGHNNIEAAQQQIRDSLVRILAGEQAIPMRVTEFPGTAEAAGLHRDVQAGLIRVLQGSVPLRVQVDPAGEQISTTESRRPG